METFCLFLADTILVVHFFFVLFIVLGLVLILAGGVFSWSWVRNPWFRVAHLAGIGLVVVQSWLGRVCPLTTWEMLLRSKAGENAYSGSFISHWLAKFVYYQAPEWVFSLCYTLFGLLVVASWFWVRPRFPKR